MTNRQTPKAVKKELDRLVEAFFQAVSFETGQVPEYRNIHGLFIEPGLLIKNSGATPEICSVHQFIESRQKTVDSGQLTRFLEVEISETTEVFGNVAHRLSVYAKSGTLQGVAFAVRGMVSTQYVLTPSGWRISAMAWDDERPGLALAQKLGPAQFGAA